MINLVIGMGEVGKAIQQILGCDSINSNFDNLKDYDTIHICFPYSDEFIEQVKSYQETYKPSLTIVHSTVPVGTCKKLGAVHSPIRGIHPQWSRSK